MSRSVRGRCPAPIPAAHLRLGLVLEIGQFSREPLFARDTSHVLFTEESFDNPVQIPDCGALNVTRLCEILHLLFQICLIGGQLLELRLFGLPFAVTFSPQACDDFL